MLNQYAWPSAPVQKETWEDYEQLWKREPRYEERFIRSKLNQIDNNLDVFWVPSPVWDLYVVQEADRDGYYSQTDVVPPFYQGFFKWLTTSVPSEVKITWIHGRSVDPVNYVRLLVPHLTRYAEGIKFLLSRRQDRNLNYALMVARTEISALESCANNPGDVCRSLLLAAIRVETEALKTNSVVLFRATNGFNPETKDLFPEDEAYRKFNLLDYPRGIKRYWIHSLSFSYSVMAGFIIDGNPLTGACTFAYGTLMPHVYAVLLERQWLYTSGYKLVYLPAVSQYLGAVYFGDYFHPRTRSMTDDKETDAKVTEPRWYIDSSDQFNVAPFEFHGDFNIACSRYLKEFTDKFMHQVRFLKVNGKFSGDEGFIDDSRRMISDLHEYQKLINFADRQHA